MSFNTVTGSQYLHSTKHIQIWLQSIMSDHVVPSKKNYNKMLDLGCGPGGNTAQFIQHFRPNMVIGVDKNEEYLELARKNQDGCHAYIFQQCDLNVKDDLLKILKDHPDIDLVVSSCALHWVSDPLETFHILRESLPGHVEHVHMMVKKSIQGLPKVAESISNHPKWKPYFQNDEFLPMFMNTENQIFPSDQFLRNLSGLNYDQVKETIIPANYEFATYEEAVGFLKWVLPFTKFIPEHEKDEFLRDCWNLSLKLCECKDGKLQHRVEISLLQATSPPLPSLTHDDHQ